MEATKVTPAESPLAGGSIVVEEKPTIDAVALAAQVAELLKKQEAQENLLRAAQRTQLRLERQLDETTKKVAQPPPVPGAAPVEPTPELLERLVENGRWQEAVDKIAEQKVQKLLAQRDALAQQEQALQERQRRLEASKADVIKYYPELDPQTGNEAAVESQVFNEVLNAHPEYWQNELGPTLAMMEAERLMAARGMKPRSWSVLAEGRAPRSTSTALPPSRGTSSKSPYILTADERAYCDHVGLKYADYAKTRAMTDQTGGVEAS